MPVQTRSQTKISKSDSDKWMTPPEVLNPLKKEFKFNFDPCPITWKPGDPDGLAIEWGTRTFCNPPYSNTGKWIEKAYTEWKKGKLVVLLINSITDTKAFHEYIYENAELRFIKGRVKFIKPNDLGKPKPSPKPSMIVIFRP